MTSGMRLSWSWRGCA